MHWLEAASAASGALQAFSNRAPVCRACMRKQPLLVLQYHGSQ
jgi:hypothetical protein